MGLLDTLMRQVASDGNLSPTMMTAVNSLLAQNTAAGGNQAQNAAASNASDPNAGNLLNGIGGLISKLQDAGHGDTVNSWVSKGQNKPLDPSHLGAALGQKNVSAAAQQAGVSEPELLSQLANALPGIVSKLAASGTVPSLQQFATAFLQQK